MGYDSYGNAETKVKGSTVRSDLRKGAQFYLQTTIPDPATVEFRVKYKGLHWTIASISKDGVFTPSGQAEQFPWADWHGKVKVAPPVKERAVTSIWYPSDVIPAFGVLWQLVAFNDRVEVHTHKYDEDYRQVMCVLTLSEYGLCFEEFADWPDANVEFGSGSVSGKYTLHHITPEWN